MWGIGVIELSIKKKVEEVRREKGKEGRSEPPSSPSRLPRRGESKNQRGKQGCKTLNHCPKEDSHSARLRAPRKKV